MSISVYITSFNKDKYLSQAITSVLNQSLAPKEIIIVDDCSTDNSRNIIEKFASQYPYIIKPIYNENNLCWEIQKQMPVTSHQKLMPDGNLLLFQSRFLQPMYSSRILHPLNDPAYY